MRNHAQARDTMANREKRRLTDQFIQKIKAPEDKRFEYLDEACPGLYLRVYPTGRKVWVFEKRVKNGPKRKHTLGTYPAPSLKEAREEAREIAVEASKGIDRVALAAEERRNAEHVKRTTRTVQEVIDLHNELHLVNLASGKERKATLEAALADLLDTPISDLRRIDLQNAIDQKAKSGAKIQANRCKAALSNFGKFAWQRGHVTDHIGAGLASAVKEEARDRVLSIDEVKEILEASHEIGPLWGPFLRLLIFTAQRRSEIASLSWSQVKFDKGWLELASSDTKNKSPHIVHLSEPALEEVQKLYAARKRKGLLFTTTGQTPISGFSKMKGRLDKSLGDEFEPWRFHDLRTAFATAMGEAEVPESITDRILNHVASASAPSAVARAYNRAKMLEPRRRVIEKWADMLTGQEGDNVVKFG